MRYCDPRYDVTFKKVFGQHAETIRKVTGLTETDLANESVRRL